MITVLTGTPGAGKTLYAISELLFPMYDFDAGGWRPIPKREEDGTQSLVPRTVYTNINGLLVDHELVQADGDEGLHNWHKWAKPGSVIVVDEFQKIWPPRANGSKVPDDVQAFDTHRHMGVDFILITQNAMNVDRHLHGLTGRHLHVRRMANMHLAIVYEWDHCSRSLLYSKSLTKHPWRYKKKAFKFYKSSELHTKQKRRLPGAVWFMVIALCALGYFVPTFKARMEARVGNGSAETHKLGTAPAAARTASAARSSSALPAPAMAASGVPVQGAVASAAGPAASAAVALIGCASNGATCTCFTPQGEKADKPREYCEDKVGAHLPKKLATDQSIDWRAQPRKAAPELAALVQDGERLLEARRRGVSTAALADGE